MNPDFKSMSYLGLAAVFTAWAFILASIALNPWWVGHFTTGALSELGTPGDHVKYPWIYNSGLVITSILAFLYSVSLAYLSLNRVQVVGSAFFMIASVFLAMIEIFHGGTYPHDFVSSYFFVQADLSAFTWGIGLLLSRFRGTGITVLALSVVAPVLASLLPLTSAAEDETLGILAIDLWVFIMHFGFVRKSSGLGAKPAPSPARGTFGKPTGSRCSNSKSNSHLVSPYNSLIR